MGENPENCVVRAVGAIPQMFGKGLSFTQRCMDEMPGP
jgi:hypothetical protein